MSVTSTASESAGAAKCGPRTEPSWWLLVGGLVLALALIPVFGLQAFWAGALVTPWYLPVGGTVAALALVSFAARKRRWWPWVIVALCVALAAFEWTFLLAMTVLPRYQGPLAAGGKLPEFQATLADGSPIDASYFERGRPTALVFFQGRWCPFCMTQLRDLEAHQAEFDRLGARVVVVSIEDVDSAAQTQHDFPHLVAVSDEKRELANAIDLVNRGFAPDGGDSATPTIVIVDGEGTVRWLDRPARFIARPSATQLLARIEKLAAEAEGEATSPVKP